MTQAELEKQHLLPASTLVGIEAVHVPATRRGTHTAWSDVLALGGERYMVCVGNIAGPDGDVAPLVDAVREAFDPASDEPGSTMLVRAAEAVIRRRSLPGAPVVTAIVGVVDCLERSFTYVSAGHPPPFVRYHDGSVAALPADGSAPSAGAGDHPPAQIMVDLHEAALVLLYSHALVASYTDAGDGIRSVAGVLADPRIGPCSSPAAWIARQVLSDVSHDEATLLALAFPPGSGPSSSGEGVRPHWTAAWSFDTHSAASNGARRAFLACLRSKSGAAAIDVPAAELIFGELLGNVVRHAPGQVDIVLDWTAELPVLHVLDRGPGFRSRRKRERLPVDELSESGRGLFIVNACAPAFSVRNRNGRGTHAQATLPRA